MGAAGESKINYPLGALYGVAAVTIWAGWMAVTRLGVTTTLNAWDIVALRFGVAGLILLPVVLRKGLALDRLGWPRLILLIAGAGAPYAVVASQGLKYAPAADAGALTPGVMPLFVALLAIYLLSERLNKQKKSGLLLILAGVLAIAGQSLLSGELTKTFGHAHFLAGAFMWAVFTVIMRWGQIAPLHATALVSVGSLIGYVPAYLAISGTRILESPIRDLLTQAVYQGVLSTVVSLTLFGRAIAILGASAGATFGALVPGMAALIAIPLLGEFPLPTDWIGICAISLGVYLASGGPTGRLKKLVSKW